MKILRVAKSAGFCFGVSRSVDMANRLIDEEGSCASLGQLIHNDDAVLALKKRGLRVIESAYEAKAGESVLIRAHGVPEETYKRLVETGAKVVDATCPKVKAIHTIVNRAAENGRMVFIIGMRQHPEVEGICGWCDAHEVFENPKDLETWLTQNETFWEKPITVVVQTTQTSSNFTECCEIIKKRCTNAKIFDTICSATFTRQQEAASLAAQCDAMVVIGGRHSANSVHLAQICSEYCKNVQFIEGTDELDMSALENVHTVGLTAGASTPAWIIKEVRNKMSDEFKEDTLIEESTAEKELSFDEMLEGTLKPIYNGDKVTGVVVAITGTEISLDLGTKYSGFIPTTEFTDDGVKVEDVVKIGDKIDAVVVRVNDVEGTAMVSKKRLDAAKVWDSVEAAVDDGTVFEGVVTEENKGGVVVNVKGMRVFVPASQTDLRRGEELSQLLKKTVRLKITEVNKARKRVVGSIRKVTQSERRAAADAIWNEIEVGKHYQGVVKSLTSFGAFVDIGGIEGMVHVTELSWNRIHQPSEVVSVGDVIDVYVISFDRSIPKISLGYKDPENDPWKLFNEKYSVGDVVSVKVVTIKTFGAFAEIIPGVEGLIHISQISNRRIGKPEDVLTVGDVVDAKITAIVDEQPKHRVSLSIRALAEPAPAEVKDEEQKDNGDDALVYQVSETGEAEGNLADADESSDEN